MMRNIERKNNEKKEHCKTEQKKLRILLRTFGCQMNVRDSERVMGLFIDSGFAEARSISEADVILFNTCSVRGQAENRAISNVAELKREKAKRPGLVIGVMGCMAQNYKDKLLGRLPMLDLVCGPGNESELPGLVKDILRSRARVVAVDKVDILQPELFPEYRDNKVRAFVSIGQGCDNYCSYCIVPYVRGRERSREARDILKEVEGLARRGFKEVTLLGQNVNSYRCGKGENAFLKLLEDVNKVDGIGRIRFMTSHPKDASDGLFKAMRDLDKVWYSKGHNT